MQYSKYHSPCHTAGQTQINLPDDDDTGVTVCSKVIPFDGLDIGRKPNSTSSNDGATETGVLTFSLPETQIVIRLLKSKLLISLQQQELYYQNYEIIRNTVVIGITNGY